jgi:glycosyltransferase involved in cell wall biosynthesis
VKVGIDAHYLGNQKTGNETYTLNLIRALATVDQGKNDYVLYLTKPEVAAHPLVSDPRFQNRLLRPAKAIFRLPMAFPYELARRPVDILHAQYFVPPFVSCKTVLTVHDISFEYSPQFFRPVHRWGLKTLVPRSIRRAERVLVVSQWLKESIVSLYGTPANKISVTPLAVSEHFTPQDIASSRAYLARQFGIQQPFLLYVGNIVPGKNVEGLLRAFSQLRKKADLPQRKLVVVGPKLWGYGSLSALIDQMGLQNEVIFPGYIPQRILPYFYSACDAFVFPSFSETFGLPVLEAMSCGAPVVASARGALPEVCGDAALLVNPDSPEEIANSLYQVLHDPELSVDLRRRGRERSAAFSWETTAARTLAAYHQVM